MLANKKYTFGIVFACLVFGEGCYPPLQEIVYFHKTKHITSQDRPIAVITAIDIQQLNDTGEAPLAGFRRERSVVNSVYNSGIFRDVYFREAPPAESSHLKKVDIDIVLSSYVNDSIEWIYSWPVIYPLPLVWPIQVRSGEARVFLNAIVHRSNGTVHRIYLDSRTPFRMDYYGFFRTEPIKSAFDQSVSRALEELSMRLRATDLSLDKDTEDSGPIMHP